MSGSRRFAQDNSIRVQIQGEKAAEASSSMVKHLLDPDLGSPETMKRNTNSVSSSPPARQVADDKKPTNSHGSLRALSDFNFATDISGPRQKASCWMPDGSHHGTTSASNRSTAKRLLKDVRDE